MTTDTEKLFEFRRQKVTQWQCHKCHPFFDYDMTFHHDNVDKDKEEERSQAMIYVTYLDYVSTHMLIEGGGGRIDLSYTI